MTTRALKLAEGLSLPLDAVTQTFLVVGKRGSGKSNTAARFVEQLHHAHLPFVVLDPVDTWWGLKASLDGSKGLDVYVFGGRKQDLPLEAGAGALIADVLCEHRLSMVLSVKHLSGRERSTFMVDFARTLFQKWAGGPLHVVLEEAHELAPQSTLNAKEGEQAMLGAFKRLWKLGRASGIGGTAVTQRPASLSKDITTQSEILIAHRTIGPQDVKAIGEWVKYHGERLDILADLPTLPTGDAFVWAPEFPEGQAIGLKRTSILLRETYDSASTPKVGERRVEPRELAPVDLERLRTKMAATIEKAKAEDPRELRKQIADLKRQVAQGAPQPHPNVEPIRQAPPVLTDADRALLEKVATTIASAASLMHDDLVLADQRFRADLDRALDEYGGRIALGTTKVNQLLEKTIAKVTVQKVLDKLSAVPVTAPLHNPQSARSTPRPSPAALRPGSSRPAPATGSGNGLTGPERRIVDAIAWLAAIGVPEPEQPAVAFLARYTYNCGGFNNPKGRLRANGYVEYLPGNRIRLTEQGAAVATAPDVADLSAEELHRRVLGVLPNPEQRILKPLLAEWPSSIDNDHLARLANYAPDTGGYNNPRGRLRSLGLIEYPQPGQVRARDILFPGEAR